MIRLSFRQCMLAGFLLIALLVSWAGLRGWLVLERFAAQSRHDGEQIALLGSAMQDLAARTIELERNARQFAVLNDKSMLQRFDEQAEKALEDLQTVEKVIDERAAAQIGDWRKTATDWRTAMRRSAAPGEWQPLVQRLGELNGELESQARRWIGDRQATATAELERGRRQLGVSILIAVAGAFLVALAMSWWLTRPVGAIEREIERLGASRIENLGENGFDAPIAVRGPADLRRIGERLDWLRRRLLELEAEREQTLRHVSHELKTPLTALREGVALLQEGLAGPLAETQREVVGILQHNVMTLQGRIEGLLRLNAISLEARHLKRRPVRLKTLLEEAVQANEWRIQARGRRVEIDAPDATRSIDAEKLRVVLDNLLANAIDFSPQGGLIRLVARLDGEGFDLACIDQGPGVDCADAERIFEPFRQGRRPAPVARQGSGIGLSIVRELVTAMGGKIRLASNDELAAALPAGPGARFEIELPAENRIRET